ncbi:hypothetical protein CWB99_05335 [Pseudoalteromonas rubra]|uniref:Uncharacterized protein n=1 Tax=Pseudoalteromonas rubra TaxID=43658 RepID=A0A5S3WQM0_9GAMM|nr:hypothetical protein [Pseudoalteromonas rubra]TMP30950.1 hypothetical protein CWB99_05335 [Pseudoalteromonas rubra]TMP37162.1 hypothetical protein CWC00_00575 [Pseudoalteromonas rubra]
MKLKINKKKLKSLTQDNKVQLEQTPQVAGAGFGTMTGTTRPGSTCQDTSRCASRQNLSHCCNITAQASCNVGHSCLC